MTDTTRKKRKRIIEVLLFAAVTTAVLFGAAGRLDWVGGWLYIGSYVGGIVIGGLIVNRVNPEVIAARGERHKDTKPFDRVFAAFYIPSLVLFPLVAGLDAVRFRWAPLPSWTLAPGFILYALSMVLTYWAMATNPHLETTVRLQTDRGHRVITKGPYRFVRHPMYAGGILSFISAPLILGSGWVYAASAVFALLSIIRTALEDAVLRRELGGYEEYARSTRYRLLPGVW